MKTQFVKAALYMVLTIIIFCEFGPPVLFAQSVENNETTVFLQEDDIQLVVIVNPLEPTVGTILLTVSPVISSSGDAIQNAIVKIRMEDETGEELYESYALNTPQNLNDYKTNFLLKKPGMWEILITVENKDKPAVKFNTEITVKDRNIVGTKIGTIVWIVVSLILFSGVGYIAFRIRSSTYKLR